MTSYLCAADRIGDSDVWNPHPFKGWGGKHYLFQRWMHNQTQTKTQTKFIQQKQIQVPYQLYITFMNIQIVTSPWHITDYKHVVRPPLRSYLTADTEATQKGNACTAVMETAMQLIDN